MERPAAGLRERTRRAVRSDLVATAMALFIDQGYDETTVEDIASTAGMSRRSYFRYFASKDEILAEGLAAIGRDIAEAVTSRPGDESPWTALRRGFDGLIAQAERHPRAHDIGTGGTALELVNHSKHLQWQESIASALEARLPGSEHDRELRAQATAAAGIACFNVAQKHWHESSAGTTLGDLLDGAMRAVHTLG